MTRACARGVVTLLLLMPMTAEAQFTEVPPPAAYAIRGARLFQPDGTVREGVTIVVRGGLIEAIGPQVEPPPDAHTLAGDSLHLYPGFLDAEGEIEFEFPERDFDTDQVESWNPPRELQGFTPERRVVDHLGEDLDGSDLAGARREGVLAAAVHPDAGLMPGRGALLLFRPEASSGQGMVVLPELAPVMAFERGRGVYPSQLFGLMAFFRQQFADAARYQEVWSAYRQRPQGMETPVWDPAYDVLGRIRSQGRVFFRADGAEDIRRALRLGDELGFTPTIVGGREAWKLADELARRDVAVLVSLDFPEPERWDPETEETDEPLAPAAWREKRDIEQAYANAGRLAVADVRFALTSGGGSANLLEGVHKAVEHGLSEEDALRALTTWPAEIYGLPALSRLEVGFPATFVAFDKPAFEDGASVAYAVVEGHVETGAAAPGAGPSEPAEVDVSGTWELEITAQGLELGGTMTLTQSGQSFDGSMVADFGEAAIEDGQVSGRDLTFRVIPDGDPGQAVTVTGSVEGDRFTGTGQQGETTFRIRATRQPGGAA